MDLADQMRELGVEEFTYGGAYVRFRVGVAIPRTLTPDKPERVEPETILSRAAKQGLGKLPFPGAE